MISFSIKELKAAALFCSEDESRWVLRSVQFCRKLESNPPRLISTDGRALLVIESSEAQVSDAAEEFLMPMEIIPAIVAIAKRGVPLHAWIEHGSLKIESAGGVTIITKPIDGQYPNWHQVIPNEDESNGKTPAALSGIYLAKFDQAVELLGNYSASFCGPLGPVVMSFQSGNAVGVLMPLRIDGEWGSDLYRKLIKERTEIQGAKLKSTADQAA